MGFTISWNKLTYSFCYKVKWALNKKKRNVQKKTKNTNQPKIHQETTNKTPQLTYKRLACWTTRKQISQEDEVQWSVALQSSVRVSVSERLSSEMLWFLNFFHLATQTNCMFKLLIGFLNCHAMFKVWFDASLNDSLETKNELRQCLLFNFLALIFSQFCERKRK